MTRMHVAWSVFLAVPLLVGFTVLRRPPAAHAPPLRLVGGAECFDRQTCIPSTHHRTTSGSGYMVYPHGCLGPFSSSCPHPECAATEEDREDVEDVALSVVWGEFENATASQIRQLLRYYSSVATFNAERKAIQLVGCDRRSIIGHIPLDAGQIAALE